MWEFDHKEGWVPKNSCFWRVVLEKTLESPFGQQRDHKSILKEINPEYSLEGLIMKLKLQYFGHLMWRTDSLEKTLMLERLKTEGEGDDRGWDVGWHHQLNGHEFEQTLGDGEVHFVTKSQTRLSDWTTPPSLSIHLLMHTWVASKFWWL